MAEPNDKQSTRGRSLTDKIDSLLEILPSEKVIYALTALTATIIPAAWGYASAKYGMPVNPETYLALPFILGGVSGLSIGAEVEEIKLMKKPGLYKKIGAMAGAIATPLMAAGSYQLGEYIGEYMNSLF